MAGVFRRDQFVKQVAAIGRQEVPQVPYKFRVQLPEDRDPMTRDTGKLTNTDNSGLRFPTLSSDENYRYWNASGYSRFKPRTFPFKVPPHRLINPWLKEFIYFLNNIDPHRFTFSRLGERFGLKEDSVQKLVKNFDTKLWLRDNELVDLPFTTESRGDLDWEYRRAARGELSVRQISKNIRVQDTKEVMYARHHGWQEIGNEWEMTEQEPEEFKGKSTTADYLRKQAIEIEGMSAFPFGQFRDPVVKRTDVELPVITGKDIKISNWVDPSDKIVF